MQEPRGDEGVNTLYITVSMNTSGCVALYVCEGDAVQAAHVKISGQHKSFKRPSESID